MISVIFQEAVQGDMSNAGYSNNEIWIKKYTQLEKSSQFILLTHKEA